MKKKPRITKKQKIGLIMLGIFLALVLLELSLRVTGYVMLEMQRAKNTVGEDDEYVILCLGESTTAELLIGESSWPSELKKLLEKKDIGKFSIINEGIGGTNTALISSRLEKNLDRYQPHIVITMMGINDGPNENDEFVKMYYENMKKNEIKLFLKNTRIIKLLNLIKIHLKGKFLYRRYINTTESHEIFNLGLEYFEHGNLEKSKYYFKKNILMNPKDGNSYFMIGRIYEMKGNLEYAEKMYKKAILFSNRSDNALINLFNIHYQQNNKGIENSFIKSLSFNRKNISMTKYHYQYTYNLLKENNIKFVVMQYPRREIEEFKNFFTEEQQKDIIFVENKENFKEALENASYDDLFVDRFASDFGHCTIKGNRLIAENVADAIVKETDIS
jgi:lysophospholipase L1-like esterase